MSGRIGFARLCAMVLAGLGAVASGPARAQQDQAPGDLLTLAKGAVLVSASVDPEGALALSDGDDASHWSASTKKHAPPYGFVFELLAPAMLRDVGIDGAGPRPGGVAGGSAGTVRIEGSAGGPDGPWVDLVRFTAAPDGPTLAPVALPGPFRWLRFTIGGAQQPDAAWVYLDEVLAYGSLTPPGEPDRFTGVFQTGRKDFIELKQDGDLISGCYLENSGRSVGTISGAVQDGVALINWRSDRDINGTAFMTVDSTGALSGVSYRHKSRSAWGGPVAPEGTLTPCSPQPVAAAAPQPQVDPIVKALEEIGEARIYGILFEYDSDVPKPSATPALERLRAALAGAPGLSVDIEGHTDGDGADAYNLDLSQRRAASVVAWLAGRGIDSGRLNPVGKGESQPVASNATADGKALNRRVEVRRR